MSLLRDRPNRRAQGRVGLGAAIAWLMRCGYLVSIPLTDEQDYDLVADIDGELCKIQVKTTYYQVNGDVYQVQLQVRGGNRSGTGKTKHFDPQAVDFVFVLTDDGEKYFIPSDAITARTMINLSERYDPFKVK